MKNFNIPSKYNSSVIRKIKDDRKAEDRMKKDCSPSEIDLGGLKFYLARHFGFCYGVENAIEVSFRALEENPDKRVFLLSEIIHNPIVNDDLMERGVHFIMDTSGNQLIPWDEIGEEDIIIVPAFGTTLEIEKIIEDKKLTTERYISTCPFVEKVWNKAAKIGAQGYSVIIHGKPMHEESRSTFSHSQEGAPSLIIRNMEEAVALSHYICGEKSADDFFVEFEGRYSVGFDPEKDLKRVGVVNQTTMLASETQAISDYIKQVLQQHYALSKETIKEHFADTRDTLCYATNDNQQAVLQLRETPGDFSVVVGGYKSSNTSHLYDLMHEKLPSYYIPRASHITDEGLITHWDFDANTETTSQLNMNSEDELHILITSGASCPDSIVEDVMEQLSKVYGKHAEYKAWRDRVLHT